MRIGIISDTHNNLIGADDAVSILKSEKIDTVFHCGDVTSCEVIDLFKDFCVHLVWGNCDRDTIAIQFSIELCIPGSSVGQTYFDHIDSKSIAMVHGNDEGLLYKLIESGSYDYVFHGHTHSQRDEMIGKTHVINPGAIGGQFRKSFCILDTKTGETTFYNVE